MRICHPLPLGKRQGEGRSKRDYVLAKSSAADWTLWMSQA
jgi:hypothetical protein